MQDIESHSAMLRSWKVVNCPFVRFAWPAATDSYTLAGGGAGQNGAAEEEWEPRFTFHGFRYAQVDNWPGELDPVAITAVVIHNDMRRTGWFECSDQC